MLPSPSDPSNKMLHRAFVFHLAQLFVTSHSFQFSRKTKLRVPDYRKSVTMAAETSSTSSSSSSVEAGKKRPLRSIHSMISSNDSTNVASLGDIVTVQLELTAENGYVSENLFDSSGEITLVLGWGNYLPGLHELLEGMSEGESVSGVSVDAGFGKHNPDLVIEVPKANLKKVQNMDKIVPNATLNLQGGIQVVVLDVTPDTITVDANHPLAGSGYSCDLKVLSIDPYPVDKLDFSSKQQQSKFEVATFAMGCFWGVELAFMRTPGVVGTRAGYTQGTMNPSSEEIKTGETGHREAVLVVYDPKKVSYKEILAVYNERLQVTAPEYFKMDLFAEDDEEDIDSQYKHGLFYHNEEQEQLAREYVGSIKDSRYADVELKPSTVFYSAEEKHQQYLYKGGQAARKGCRETIRCYG